MSLVFWTAVALIGYHLLVYPHLARFLASRWRDRLPPRPQTPDAELPEVTLIVPAHNEEAVIEAKVENIAALDYPSGKLTAKICLDGCSDRTETLARRAMERSPAAVAIDLVSQQACRGKVAVLNENIAQTDAKIIGLSDTSALLDPLALARAARWFSDPTVGVVCATYSPSSMASEGERLYWKKQNSLKADEAVIAAPMGAHGAFYLFRRSAWTPMPPETINDDFILPMSIVLRGFRMVYDEGVAAHELETSAVSHEFRRRIRIGAGNLQQVIMLWRLADPRKPKLAFVFCSGKALRALLPLLAATAMCASLWLALSGAVLHQTLVITAIAGSAGAYTFSLLCPKLGAPYLATIGYFVRGLTASFLGAVLLLAQQQGQLWRTSSAAKHSGAKQQGAGS